MVGKLAEFLEIECAAAAEVEGGDLLPQRFVECGICHGEIVGRVVLADEGNECRYVGPAFFLKCNAQATGLCKQAAGDDFLVSGECGIHWRISR